MEHERAIREVAENYEAQISESKSAKEAVRQEMRSEMDAERARILEEAERSVESKISSMQDQLGESKREIEILKEKLSEAEKKEGGSLEDVAELNLLRGGVTRNDADALRAEIDDLTAAVQTGIAERDALRDRDAAIIKKLKDTMVVYEDALAECGINPKALAPKGDGDDDDDESRRVSRVEELASLKKRVKALTSELATTKEQLANARLEVAALEEESERRDSAAIEPAVPVIEPSKKNLRKYSRRLSTLQSLQSDRRESLRMIIDMKGDIRGMKEEAARKRKQLEGERDHYKGLLEELKKAVEERAEGNLLFLSVLEEKNFSESVKLTKQTLEASQNAMKRRKPHDAIEEVKNNIMRLLSAVLPRLERVDKNFKRKQHKWAKLKSKIVKSAALIGAKPSIVTAKMCPVCGSNPFVEASLKSGGLGEREPHENYSRGNQPFSRESGEARGNRSASNSRPSPSSGRRSMAMAVRSAAKMSALSRKKRWGAAGMQRNKTLPELVSEREKRRFDAPLGSTVADSHSAAYLPSLALAKSAFLMGSNSSSPAAESNRSRGESKKKKAPPPWAAKMLSKNSRTAPGRPRHKISLYLAQSLAINK